MAEHEFDAGSYFSPESWSKEWEEKHGKGFHLEKLNGMLQKYLDQMVKGRAAIKFLFPFCGKDICMKWLSGLGHTVTGCDCAPLAFTQFFKEQNTKYTTEKTETFTIHTSEDGKLKMYCGDFYDFSVKDDGPFDVIWDRGGFNAVNASEQTKYRDLIISLLKPDGQYYLINFDLEDQTESDKMGNLTDAKIKEYFDTEKFKVSLREEFVPASFYNGDLCAGMDDWMEKLTIITKK